MQPKVQDVQLYAVTNKGALLQYPKVKVVGAKYMPSGGDLTNPADREAITMLEDKMIEVYGESIIQKECAAGPKVDLSRKMIRPIHVPVLLQELFTHSVTELDLTNSQLGPQGGVAIAEGLKRNSTLRSLK